MARGHVVLPRRGQRRATTWIPSADSTDIQALAAGGVVLDQDFSGAQVDATGPFTITRTVGYIAVATDQAAATEFPFGAVGCMVVQEVARVGGVGNVPTPISEEGDDQWFVYQGFATGGIFVTGGMAPFQYVFPFDSRAQRKVEEGQAIVWTVENASATDGLNYILKFRMLIKRH